MTPFRRFLLRLCRLLVACVRARADRAGRHVAGTGRDRRPLPDRSGQDHLELHRRHPGGDAAPPAADGGRGAEDGARHLGAAVGRSRHADLGLRSRLQFQPRAGADRRRHRQRSLDSQRRSRLRASPHREPRPHRDRARPDEHDVRQPGDRRRHQHGHQGRQGADERRRLHRARHAAVEQQRRLRARQRGRASTTTSPSPARSRPTTRPCRPVSRRNGGYVDIDPYRNITLRGAARLRNQRQHPVQLVRPLHRHQAQLRPGRAGGSQRQRLHVAVLHARRDRRILLQRPLEAGHRRQLQHDLPARPGLRQPAGSIPVQRRFLVQRPPSAGRLQEPGDHHRRGRGHRRHRLQPAVGLQQHPRAQ